MYFSSDRLKNGSFPLLCLYSLRTMFNFLKEILSFIIVQSSKIHSWLFWNGVPLFFVSISILIFTYLFILGLYTLLSTNSCNLKMNNSSGSLYSELAYLRANIILCVHTGSLLFFCKRRRKLKCQKMFVLNYLQVEPLILTVMLGGIFKYGDI